MESSDCKQNSHTHSDTKFMSDGWKIDWRENWKENLYISVMLEIT